MKEIDTTLSDEQIWLRLGLITLAHTTQMRPGLWSHGHHGAAVLSGYFLLKEQPLSNQVHRAITAHIKHLADQSYTPFSAELADKQLVTIDPLITQLDECASSLSAVGHGVIYAMLALKAIQLDPTLATAGIINGMVNLLQSTIHNDTTRYVGIQNYQSECIDDNNIETFTTISDAAKYVLYDNETVYPNQVIEGEKYFFSSNKLHNITHAHALLELENLGYETLAKKGLDSLRKQLHLNRIIPNDIAPYTATQTLDPRSKPFWRRQKSDPHHCKLAYATLSLLPLVDTQDHEKILKNASKYWALLP